MLVDKDLPRPSHRGFWLNAFILGAALLIFPLSASAGLFGNKFENEVKTEQVAINLHNETMQGGYQLINTEKVKALLDDGKDVLIIDAMPFKDSYKKQHIPTAQQFLFPVSSMPEWNNAETNGQSEQDFTQMLGADKDKMLVFYCGFVKCGRSHNAATWAVKLGYNNVYRYPGGIYAWKGAGFKTASVK
ncbi:rhodanese-like domain-containing protein [Pseudomonadota bacterium]